MSKHNPPEGYVFIPRRSDRSIAADLLKAAEDAGFGRGVESVRTITGGYFVKEEIAQVYAEKFDGDVQASESADGSSASTEGSSASTEGSSGSTEPADFPEGEPTDKWTVKQLEAYAAAQEPALDLAGDKPAKLKAVSDHYADANKK